MSAMITWPQVTRAEAALIAYQTVSSWLQTQSYGEVMKRLDAKIAEKQALIVEYGKQKSVSGAK